MNNANLMISEDGDSYIIQVSGRANFDYAVPLRELSRNLSPNYRKIVFEMSGCTAVDSTFMGVMTMLALAARKQGKRTSICNITPTVFGLLKGLGVDKLFVFEEKEITAAPGKTADSALNVAANTEALPRARAVVDAHKALVDIEPENAAKFDKVIEFAEKDLKKMEKPTE